MQRHFLTYIMSLTCMPQITTVNPFYNGIRYNSIIRYNVSLVCTKISGSLFFIDSPVIFTEIIRYRYLLESPRRGDSNKYTKRMIYKRKTKKKIRYSCFIRFHIKFLYNSKFDFTAQSLITNSVPLCRYIFGLIYLTLKRCRANAQVNL